MEGGKNIQSRNREHTNRNNSVKTGLYGIYPNPGNGVFKIMYGLKKKMRVRIMVYDVSGRRIKTIENRIKKPGVYTVTWDGRDRDGRKLHSGIYIVNMEIGSFYRESKKIVLTR